MAVNSQGHDLSLSDQIDVLLEWGRAHQVNVTYSAIAARGDVSASNLYKIHRGENTNPGISALRSLADYFGVGLGYFDCPTSDDCWRYLDKVAQQRAWGDRNNLGRPSLRSDEITPDVLDALESMIAHVRRREGWSDEE